MGRSGRPVLEDAVPSWETSDTNLDEQSHRDFVLKQPSTVGPWVALGLGITLLAFLGSLVYMNLLLPPSAAVSPERALRPEAEFVSPGLHPKRTSQRSLERRKPAITVVPQGWAPNALLGGQGPALPPERSVASRHAPDATYTTPDLGWTPVKGRHTEQKRLTNYFCLRRWATSFSPSPFSLAILRRARVRDLALKA